MLIICNDCKNKFDLSLQPLENRVVKSGVKETFFRCPRCGSSFPIMKTTMEIRKKMLRLNQLKQTAKNEKFLTKKMAQNKVEEINDLRKEIEKAINFI